MSSPLPSPRVHEQIVGALERGCDVITEKPMTTDEQKCQAILDAERRRGLHELAAGMNPTWGSVFHAQHGDGSVDASLFGFALKRHSDLYMSQLQSIVHYATRRHRFVPPKFTMPHEVSVVT